LAATGAGLSLRPSAAEAQILDPPVRTLPRPVRPKLPPETPDPVLAPDDQALADPGFAPDFGTTTVTPADAQDGIDPQDAASTEVEAREAQDAATLGASRSTSATIRSPLSPTASTARPKASAIASACRSGPSAHT
jgi:hypothetical protein